MRRSNLPAAGFPLDARDRELNNFLRFLPGYEASQLTTCKKTGQSQGFALFATAAHARSSVLAVSGILFDENCVLRAELAYKNLVVSDHKTIRPMRAIALSNSSDHGDQSSGALSALRAVCGCFAAERGCGRGVAVPSLRFVRCLGRWQADGCRGAQCSNGA